MSRFLLQIICPLTGIILLLTSGVLADARGGDLPSSWLLFDAADGETSQHLYRLSPDNRQITRLTTTQQRYSHPTGSPNGAWIAFLRWENNGWQLYRMRADAGQHYKVAHSDRNITSHTWSPDGRSLAYISSMPQTIDQYIYTVNLRGSQPTELKRWNRIHHLAWSPDGNNLLMDATVLSSDIMRLSLSDARFTHLTTSPFNDSMPVWSPDGAWIAYTSAQYPGGLYRMRPDGTQLQLILDDPYIAERSLSWSPDGEWLAFTSERGSHRAIYRVRPDGSDLQRLTEADMQYGGLSWIASVNLPFHNMIAIFFGMGLLLTGACHTFWCRNRL